MPKQHLTQNAPKTWQLGSLATWPGEENVNAVTLRRLRPKEDIADAGAGSGSGRTAASNIQLTKMPAPLTALPCPSLRPNEPTKSPNLIYDGQMARRAKNNFRIAIVSHAQLTPPPPSTPSGLWSGHTFRYFI